MKTLVLTGATLFGLMVVDGTQVQAAGPGFHTGWPTYGYGYTGTLPPWETYRGGYNSPYGGVWQGRYQFHDTSHYDYVPGGMRMINGQMIYVPGHYEWHQDGHWDYRRAPYRRY